MKAPLMLLPREASMYEEAVDHRSIRATQLLRDHFSRKPWYGAALILMDVVLWFRLLVP